MNDEIVTKPFHVLVVFGDAPLRRTIKATLRQLGYQGVHAVENGVEALQWLDSGQKVDVIITSLHRTRLDGFELLERIRSQPNTKNLPVVLVAGKATEQLVAQAIETDADGYVLMPFTPADLERRIDELIERRTKPSLYQQLLSSGQATLETAPQESIMWFREAVHENPSNPIGHYWLGQALERAGLMDEAQKAYRTAVELNPLHVKSMDRLREFYRKSGRTDELYDILTRMYRARPDRRDVALELGPLALAKGDVERGIACFEFLVGSVRNRPKALGAVLARFYRFDVLRADVARLAMSVYLEAVEKDAEAAYLLAQILTACDHAAQARDGLVKLLRRSKEFEKPFVIKVHLLLAHIYDKVGIERLAKEHRETARSLQAS
ncbi:response regulator [Desulfosoma caldarium]|uniref:response regulator n=1 Tax=Desulfosoma caldarium TaxID=610254 RepID=UPI0014734592|nr:response regulator [Desulfosoma caldarium]